jgi:hypothetical protein
MTGLRTREGVDTRLVRERTGVDPFERYAPQVEAAAPRARWSAAATGWSPVAAG